MGCAATIISQQPEPPVSFCTGEREVFKPRVAMSTFEWMKRNFRLVVGQRAGQRWDAEYLPYAKMILDTLDAPYVRKVFIIGGSQSGKTTLCDGHILKLMVEGRGNAGILMPDEKALERMFEGRLHKHVKRSPVLSRILSDQQHALQRSEIKFKNGVTIGGMWANSESSISSVTLLELYIDEEDAFQNKAAVGITEERCTDYPNTHKIIRGCKLRGMQGESTIWRDMHAQADVIYHYQARCPACMAEQHMRFEQIKVPKDVRDPARIRRERLARYECEHCGARWNDIMRDRALALGRLEPDRQVERPVVVGFLLRAVEFPRVSLSTIMAEWFESEGDPVKRQNWDNNRWSKEYKAIVQETSEELLLKLVDPSVQPLVVPERALAVTLAADTQKDGFFYSIWAHGLDPVEDWVLDYGTLPGLDALQAMVFDLTLKRDGGDEMVGIWRAAVDTGGTRHEGEDVSRTQQVYEWLLKQPLGKVFGTKGMSRPSAGQYVRWIDTLRLPHGRKASGVGRAYLVDVDYLKRLLMARLHVDAVEPIRLHEHVERGYVKHFLAERLVLNKQRREVWERVSRDNHYLDCAVLHLAMRHPQWTPPLHVLARPAGEVEPPQERPGSGEARRKPGWFERRHR